MDPEVGRFVSMDPFGGFQQEPGTLHRYLYVLDDPVNDTDPSGEIGVGGVLIIIAVLVLLYLLRERQLRNIKERFQGEKRNRALLSELTEVARNRDQAAIRGMIEIYPRCLSEGVEYCGPVCLQEDGKTCEVGPPSALTYRLRKRCDWFDCSESTDDTLGFYHCHPDSEDFSGEDLQTASFQVLPLYLITPKGVMMRYHPVLGRLELGRVTGE